MFELKKYRSIIDIILYLLIVFFVFNFRVNSNFSFLVSEFLFCFYLIGIILILRSGVLKYIYEPPVFFIFFLFVYEFLKFPYYFGYDTAAHLVSSTGISATRKPMSDFYSTSVYLLLYQILCLAILFFTYFLIRKKAEVEFRPSAVEIKKENALFYFSLLLFLFAAVRVLMLTGGNFLFLLTRRSGNSEANDIVKDNYIVALSCATVLIAIPILAGIKAFAGKPWRSLLFLYIPNIILEYIITGNRGVALYSVLIFIIIVSLKRKFSIIKISFVGFAIIMAFSILGLVRRSSSNTDNIVQNIKEQSDVEDQWYYELTSYQVQLRDEAVYNATPITGILTGESYLNIIFFPLPSSMVGDLKPKFLDVIVADIFYNRNDVGLPLNAMGESYLNFGVFGCLVFIVIGSIMAGITNFLSAKGSIKFFCLSLVLCFYAQAWSTTYIVYVLQYTILLYVPIKLIKVKKLGYAK